MTRTSKTHPLKIDWIGDPPLHARIGMTFCPGKIQAHSMTGSWERSLDLDLQRMVQQETTHVVCLLESHELDALKVPNLAAKAREYRLEYFSLSIKDVSVPDTQWEAAWMNLRPAILEACRHGYLVMFCKGGLGRTGMFAALLLQELGLSALDAVDLVRAIRKGTIETQAQLEYVMNYRSAASVS